jgi:gamma-D-glutamyl-L-lysine dipeptidyl-peptidase
MNHTSRDVPIEQLRQTMYTWNNIIDRDLMVKEITRMIEQARELLASDPRTALFDVRGTFSNGTIVLEGEIDRLFADPFRRFLRERTTEKITWNIRLLPDASLETPYGVTSLSVSNIFKNPSHAAELGTQALLGTPVRILKKEGLWSYVCLPEGYLGWTDNKLAAMNAASFEAWATSRKIIITTDSAQVLRVPGVAGERVSDIVAGCILSIIRELDDFFEAGYPDGRRGYVRRDDAAYLDTWLKRAEPSGVSVATTAQRFYGAPYFWGGTSPKALDCSGLVRMSFFLNGILLPRDADQQALAGDHVSRQELQPGDLVFFSGNGAGNGNCHKIVHVGISLGGDRFIQASGDVHSSNLDLPYGDSRQGTFATARRIIGASNTRGILRLRDLPCYNRENTRFDDLWGAVLNASNPPTDTSRTGPV